MSLCRNCNQPIIWTKRADGDGFNPPMDMTEECVITFSVEMIDGQWVGRAVNSPAPVELKSHICHTREIPQPIVQLVEIYRDDKRKEHTLKHGPRLAKKCPKCKVKKGEWCIGVTTGEEIKTLHKERTS